MSNIKWTDGTTPYGANVYCNIELFDSWDTYADYIKTFHVRKLIPIGNGFVIKTKELSEMLSTLHQISIEHPKLITIIEIEDNE